MSTQQEGKKMILLCERKCLCFRNVSKRGRGLFFFFFVKIGIIQRSDMVNHLCVERFSVFFFFLNLLTEHYFCRIARIQFVHLTSKTSTVVEEEKKETLLKRANR